jgi:nitroreductase
MEFDKIIKDRVSIRKYQKRNIDESQLNYILKCGHAAPTAGNVQPWEFIVVKDTAMKRKIVDTTYVGNQKNAFKHQEWLMDAPVFIIVCANKDRVIAKYGEESMKKLIYLDCSASVENMLLAAVDLNLGSCYISGFKENELSQALQLPSSFEVIAFIPIGYVGGASIKRKKRPLREVVHRDFYNK